MIAPRKEAVMRRFSWAGCVALAAAAGGGFLVGEAVHRNDPVTVQLCDGGDLSADPPAFPEPPTPLAPPQLVEEIDLSCPPKVAAAFGSESMEPPLAAAADGQIRTVNFEIPAAPPAGADVLSVMPYLTDDPEPGLLPPLGDVPPLPTSPTPDPDNPIFQAVKKFVDTAARLPERSPEVTDKVPLGKPPVSEQPSSAGKPK
jgi:hypothetical protein